MNKGFYLAVEVGRSKIVSAVFTMKLACMGRERVAIKNEADSDGILTSVLECIEGALARAEVTLNDVLGLGMSVPGAVSSEAGGGFAASSPRWESDPLRVQLQAELGLPVFVENRGNAATLGIYEGEYAGKSGDLIGIFIGGGIRSGMILGGNLFRGASGWAGEVGHMVLKRGGPKCRCGNNGCLEALASRAAILSRIQAGASAGRRTILGEVAGHEIERAKNSDLRKALFRGDALVAESILESAEYTGLAVASLANLFNPAVFVLGGGLIRALASEMVPVILETVDQHVMPGTSKGLKILVSDLDDHAGLLGAAAWARRNRLSKT